MELSEGIQGELVVLRYDRLCVIGTEGRLEKTLEELTSPNDSLELAPVGERQGRQTLPGFCLRPAVDIIASISYQGDASIQAYSLHQDEAIRMVSESMQGWGFISRTPTERFVKALALEMTGAVMNYHVMAAVAERGSLDFERLFGAVYYLNHLANYWGVAHEDGRKAAAMIFNIQLPSSKFDLA